MPRGPETHPAGVVSLCAGRRMTRPSETPCARKILSTLAAQGLQASGHRRRSRGSDAFLHRRPRGSGDFDMGIQKASSVCWSALNSCSALSASRRASPKTRRIASAILSWPRGSPSSSGAASRTTSCWTRPPTEAEGPRRFGTQIRRMLADPRSESLVTNFAAQWLFLRDVESKQPDVLLFPDFDDGLRNGFERETELFLDSILRENRSVLDLLTANYTFSMTGWRSITASRTSKAATSAAIRFQTAAVRGRSAGPGQHPDADVVCHQDLAGGARQVGSGESSSTLAPPPPPPNIPALKTEGKQAGETLSMREAMTQHRANPCLRGLPCSHGSYRIRDGKFRRGRPVAGRRVRQAPSTTSGVFPDGTKFEGMAGLRESPAQPSRSVCRAPSPGSC